MTHTDRRHFMAQSLGALATVALTPSLAELSPMRGSSATLVVGMIGVGRQGRAILQELQQIEGVEIAAVCDVDPGRLKRAVRRIRGLRGYETHQEMLEKEKTLQAIIVATPTHLHLEPALAALEAKLHVYCEAPLASTVEDSAALASAARKSERVFACGLLARSNPIYKLARSFFRSGSLRDLVSLRAQDFQKTTWRSAAPDPAREKALNWRLDSTVSLGLAGELGIHQFDAYQWFMRKYPVSVRGSGSVRIHKDGRDVADTVACDLAFDDGLRLSWQSTLGNSYDGRYEIYSGAMASFKLAWTAGWMFKEADAPTQGWEVYANRQTFHNDEGITLIADATKLAAQGKLEDGVGLPNPPVHYALANFVEACTDGAEINCSAEEGHRSTVVAVLASRAVTSGEEVPIDPKLFDLR
ncbi:MAG: putative dehydrogenase [Planctomycetota bacterium]|jgi:predicted dehydrogenase